MKKIIFFFLTISFSSVVFAQQVKEKVNGWHLLDAEKDGYSGISLGKAYELLKGRKSTTVIVAVIDSGIDTLQEDLSAILWKNEKEIDGNGIDDDGNGYVDDIYGWNFCGSKDGKNLDHNSLEITRVYHQWKNEFEGKKEKAIPNDRKFLYGQWVKAAAIINKDYDDAMKEKSGIVDFQMAMEQSATTIESQLSVTSFTAADVKPLLKSASKPVAASAQLWNELFAKADDAAANNTSFLQEVRDYTNQLDVKIKRKLEVPEDTRGLLVKDDYTNINDSIYGNNNLKAGSGNHGSLVAGTIAAVRNNGIGMDGIADNVRIMAVRVVPGGDEHDKDVALGIRYAVDNGAKIINMSFGKPVSPYKQFVDDAVRYAASKGVLLVHGSGNDGKDITTDVFYPNPIFISGEHADNFITVGASGDPSTGGLVAPFSNYSNQTVDIFAPGVYIYTTAANNGYEDADGTSLASPVVTGVAALLKSYFPSLTPVQLIKLMTTAGKPITTSVLVPGEASKMTKFSTLSSSGRIVNAYDCVKEALQMESGK